MKYIRMKDGIINYSDYSDYLRIKNNYIFEKFTFLGEQQERHYGQVVKEADTIEELCDEIINIFPNGEKNIWKVDANVDLEAYGIDINEDEIYYAIWTSKGLIYVAKMNEKGKLELL